MPLGMAQVKVGYDNHNPRDQQASLTGWGKRALAAHQNQIESFPLFAAGILVAESLAVAQATVDNLAMAYIAARILYLVFYITDTAMLRSTVWGVGYFSSLALICSPAWA